MKKILYIEGIYPINTRSERIIKSLQKSHYVKVVAWDRNSIRKTRENFFIYSSLEGYGNKLKKLLGMYNFYKYLKKVFKNEKPDVIFCSQWDMLILGFLLKTKEILIYDNIDMPSSSNIFLYFILRKLEKFLLKKCDIMIYASRFFEKNYLFFKNKSILLENLPSRETIKLENIKTINKSKIKLAFIGTIRYYDILKRSIDIISKLNYIDYYFYGDGPDENKLKEYVKKKKYKNIYFYGRYEYNKISEIYSNIHMVWAAYPNKDYNVKYAISNKFFESLVYEKPTFFSKETNLGNLILKEKIGFTIDPYNIEPFFLEMNREKLEEKLEKIGNKIKEYKKEKKLFWEDYEKDFLCFLERIL